MPWFLQSLLGFTKSQGPQSFRLGNKPHAQNPDFFGGRVSDITRVHDMVRTSQKRLRLRTKQPVGVGDHADTDIPWHAASVVSHK